MVRFHAWRIGGSNPHMGLTQTCGVWHDAAEEVDRSEANVVRYHALRQILNTKEDAMSSLNARKRKA